MAGMHVVRDITLHWRLVGMAVAAGRHLAGVAASVALTTHAQAVFLLCPAATSKSCWMRTSGGSPSTCTPAGWAQHWASWLARGLTSAACAARLARSMPRPACLGESIAPAAALLQAATLSAACKFIPNVTFAVVAVLCRAPPARRCTWATWCPSCSQSGCRWASACVRLLLSLRQGATLLCWCWAGVLGWVVWSVSLMFPLCAMSVSHRTPSRCRWSSS